MRNFKLIFVLLILSFNSFVYSQYVSKRVGNYIRINIDETDGYKIGDTVTIRRSINGKSVVIGQAEIVTFRNSECALKIISENPVIQVGDFVNELKGRADNDISELFESTPNVYSKKRDHTLTYVSLGAGILISSIGNSYYTTAKKHYDEYKVATTSQDAVRLYDLAKKNYNYSKISFSIGGGLVLFALINELFLMSTPKKSNTFSIHHDVTHGMIGICYNF
jgi:hypothetical protein